MSQVKISEQTTRQKPNDMLLSKSVARIGFWSATMMTLMVGLFAVGLGTSLSFLSYLSSFFLTWAFVASMASIHYFAAEDKKIWSQLGLTFAIIYATMNSIVYYVQLVVVRTNPLGLSPQLLALFTWTPGSVFFAIDMLGYGFLTLAMLLAAPVFGGSRLGRSLRWLFVANGILFIPTLLVPVLLGAPSDSSSNVGTFALLGWCIVFIPASALLALLFRRAGTQQRVFSSSMSERSSKPIGANLGTSSAEINSA
jgi:hypothetical protein